MVKNYWMVNVMLREDGYSFMVHCNTNEEKDVINALESRKDLFDEDKDFDCAFVEKADEDSYNHFKKYVVEL